MTEFEVGAQHLRDAIQNALAVSEGKTVLQADGEVQLISPCQEGTFVQRVHITSGSGGGSVDLAPDLLKRITGLLTGIEGRVGLRLASGKITLDLRSGISGTYVLKAGVQPVAPDSTRSVPTQPTITIVPGNALRTVLSLAIPRPVTIPVEEPHAERKPYALLEATAEAIVVKGANAAMMTWGWLRSNEENQPVSMALPIGLILKGLRLASMWEGILPIGVGPVTTLGTPDLYLTWKPEQLPSEAWSVHGDQGTLWENEALCSAWIKGSCFSSLVTLYEDNNYPDALRISWNAEGISASSIPASAKILLPASRPVTSKPGTIQIPGIVLEPIEEMLSDRDCQIKITDRLVLLGAPRGFIAIPWKASQVK